jgi:template-activating factor I
MVADKSKKLKLSDNTEEIDGELVLSVEKLQEIQDELEKVPKLSFLFLLLSISKN